MKKIISSILVFGALASFAQDETSSTPSSWKAEEFKAKNGAIVTPEAGDYALGFNAVPVLGYFGNALNGAAGNTMAANFVNGDNTIFIKKFIDASTAYRVRIRITDIMDQTANFVTQDGQWDPNVTVEDLKTVSTIGATLAAGMEMRKGKGRVQGYYGAEGSVASWYNTTDYSWGNSMSVGNAAPRTTDFGTMANAASSDRTVSTSTTMYGLGANAFVGIEYFFAPKISVGAEFTWGFLYTYTAQGYTTNEEFTSTVETNKVKTASTHDFTLDTGNNGGAIYLLFHF